MESLKTIDKWVPRIYWLLLGIALHIASFGVGCQNLIITSSPASIVSFISNLIGLSAVLALTVMKGVNYEIFLPNQRGQVSPLSSVTVGKIEKTAQYDHSYLKETYEIARNSYISLKTTLRDGSLISIHDREVMMKQFLSEYPKINPRVFCSYVRIPRDSILLAASMTSTQAVSPQATKATAEAAQMSTLVQKKMVSSQLSPDYLPSPEVPGASEISEKIGGQIGGQLKNILIFAVGTSAVNTVVPAVNLGVEQQSYGICSALEGISSSCCSALLPLPSSTACSNSLTEIYNAPSGCLSNCYTSSSISWNNLDFTSCSSQGGDINVCLRNFAKINACSYGCLSSSAGQECAKIYANIRDSC